MLPVRPNWTCSVPAVIELQVLGEEQLIRYWFAEPVVTYAVWVPLSA